MNEYESIFDEARRIVEGDRREDYGDVNMSLERITNLWSTYLGFYNLTVSDFIHMMILLKVSRASTSMKRDNYVDICGYVLLLEKYYLEPKEND